MPPPSRLTRALPPLLLAISLGVVYLSTMAPGLTWANYGADGGDLIAAAASGGVAHPTGYPLYLLLARLFQLLPVGSLAFRTHLMSALATVLAALLVYALVTRSLSPSNAHCSWLAGLASGFAFGLAPLIWSQAVITEVYALHSLFVALLLTLSVQDVSLNGSQKRRDLLLGLTFGLAMGNHITTLLLLPVVLSGALRHDPALAGRKSWRDGWHVDVRSLLRRLAGLGLGLLVYLALPLRALSQPPVNWGDPLTLAGFTWLVSGALYQGQLFVLSLSSVWERVQVAAALLLEQFGIAGLGLGLIGLILFFKPSRLVISTLWIVAASSVFAIGYNTTDAFMYLIPAFLCFALWIGFGLGRLMEAASDRFRLLGPAIALLFILVLSVQAVDRWPQVDASQDQRAEQFGTDVLTLAPAGAIVFAKGDAAVFSLWYFQYALQARPDLAIVAADLLHFPWYQQTLHATYPDLVVPAPFPFPETIVVANPARPVCYVQYLETAGIACLPALSSDPP